MSLMFFLSYNEYFMIYIDVLKENDFIFVIYMWYDKYIIIYYYDIFMWLFIVIVYMFYLFLLLLILLLWLCDYLNIILFVSIILFYRYVIL